MNPEPFVIVNSINDISAKKAFGKISSFIAANTVDPLKATQSLKVGKVSDEILDKLQTMLDALEREKSLSTNTVPIPSSSKKSKKRKKDLEASPVSALESSLEIDKPLKKKKKKDKK